MIADAASPTPRPSCCCNTRAEYFYESVTRVGKGALRAVPHYFRAKIWWARSLCPPDDLNISANAVGLG